MRTPFRPRPTCYPASLQNLPSYLIVRVSKYRYNVVEFDRDATAHGHPPTYETVSENLTYGEAVETATRLASERVA